MRVWNGQLRRIYIHEVGARDGLQSEAAFVPTEEKIALIDALSQVGMAKIEVTAFVSPRSIPALRDADRVMRGIRRAPGVIYSALVPNMRGAERAIESCVDELNLVMSATETHNLANLHMTCAQSFAVLSEVATLARGAGTSVNFSLSCAFGCPMEGDVPEAVVWEWLQRFADIGVHRTTLCDTTGMAWPSQVAALTRAFRERWSRGALTLHFHNTRGMGLANILAAIDAGAERFDTSIGGLGGCPYAPGATGNVCSEDVVHALELMRYNTGVDLVRLLDISRGLPKMVGHDIPSHTLKAGRRLDLHPPPVHIDTIRERALARTARAADVKSVAK